MNKKLSLIFIIFCLFPLLAHATCDGGIFCRNTVWDNASSADIAVIGSSNKPVKINYNFGIDNSIQITTSFNNDTYRLILLHPGIDLSSNIYLYSKNYPMEGQPDTAFDVFEWLMSKLRFTSYLLNVAFPQGPTSVHSKKDIHIGSQTQGFNLIVDPGTFGSYDAPWSASGSIEPINKNSYRFSITFSLIDKNSQKVTKERFDGELNYAPTHISINDTLELKDYVIHHHENLSNIKTLGELKKYLAEHKK